VTGVACLTTLLLLFSQKEIIFANIILSFVYPYYTGNYGINQVNNYGGIPPKIRVK